MEYFSCGVHVWREEKGWGGGLVLSHSVKLINLLNPGHLAVRVNLNTLPCPHFIKTGITSRSLFARRAFHLSVYKILSGIIKCSELTNMFEHLEDHQERVTRAVSNKDLVVVYTRTIFGKRGIQISGPLAWNALPVELNHAKSLNIFRTTYFKLLS